MKSSMRSVMLALGMTVACSSAFAKTIVCESSNYTMILSVKNNIAKGDRKAADLIIDEHTGRHKFGGTDMTMTGLSVNDEKTNLGVVFEKIDENFDSATQTYVPNKCYHRVAAVGYNSAIKQAFINFGTRDMSCLGFTLPTIGLATVSYQDPTYVLPSCIESDSTLDLSLLQVKGGGDRLTSLLSEAVDACRGKISAEECYDKQLEEKGVDGLYDALAEHLDMKDEFGTYTPADNIAKQTNVLFQQLLKMPSQKKQDAIWPGMENKRPEYKGGYYDEVHGR